MYTATGAEVVRNPDDSGGAAVSWVVDDTMTYGELKARILAELAPFDPAIPTSADRLHLHTVARRGDGSAVHLYSEATADLVTSGSPAEPEAMAALADTMQLSEFAAQVCHGTTLLAWNGSTLNGQTVLVGEAAEPMAFFITFLSNDGGKSSFKLVVPKSHTLKLLKVLQPRARSCPARNDPDADDGPAGVHGPAASRS